MPIELTLPLTRERASSLRAGDDVTLTGTLIIARDAAHKRFVDAITRGEPLPFNAENAVIYYCGPTPAPDGCAVGSAGPTTSARMDAYAPELLRQGVAGMIGKGARSKAVVNAMVETRAVYFAAVGGAGALLAKHVKTARVIAYAELGAEAVYEFDVVDFPVVVATDARGVSLYDAGPYAYLSRNNN